MESGYRFGLLARLDLGSSSVVLGTLLLTLNGIQWQPPAEFIQVMS